MVVRHAFCQPNQRVIPSVRHIQSRNVAAHAIKLFTFPRSRGRVVEWYIKEIGADADVELVNVNMEEKEHKQDWYREYNPFARLPAMEDGDFKLFESGAIVLYLAEKYGKLGSSLGERAVHNQWIAFGGSTLSPAAFHEKLRETALPDILHALDTLLQQRDYLVGNEFSVSDVFVGSTLVFIRRFYTNVDMSQYPALVKYTDRLCERPACQATVLQIPVPPAAARKAA